MSIIAIFMICIFINYLIIINSLFEIYNNETSTLIEWVNTYNLTSNDNLISLLKNLIYINITYDNNNTWKIKLNKFAALSNENFKNLFKSYKPSYNKNDFFINSGDELTMKYEIKKNRSLSAGVYANTDWQLYDKGIYNPINNKCSSNILLLDHSVVIVGYGSQNGLDYWRILNSWGTDWGENGYMKLVRGKNACGIANSVISNI